MEAPPEGYRRNVGICLMNSHKKVRSFFPSKSLSAFGFRLLFIKA